MMVLTVVVIVVMVSRTACQIIRSERTCSEHKNDFSAHVSQEFAYYGNADQEKNEQKDESYKDDDGGDGTTEDDAAQNVEAKNQQK